MGLVFLGALTPLNTIAQNDVGTDVANQGQAITNVLTERLYARLNCMRIVVDSGKIVSVQLHQLPYLRALKTIDTAGCPERFRLVWLDYVQAWERKLSTHRATENLLEALPAAQGNLSGFNDITKGMEASDTDEAWRRCERVALEFGVDTSRVHIR
jgi:hypothetical protein